MYRSSLSLVFQIFTFMIFVRFLAVFPLTISNMTQLQVEGLKQ